MNVTHSPDVQTCRYKSRRRCEMPFCLLHGKSHAPTTWAPRYEDDASLGTGSFADPETVVLDLGFLLSFRRETASF